MAGAALRRLSHTNEWLYSMLEKYLDRVALILLGWLTIPLALFVLSVWLPAFWVLKHGYINSPYWHNVKAGALMVMNEIRSAWRI